MIKKSKTPYIRDVYLAYLIKGAQLTKTDEMPIIEYWMVSPTPPKEIIQWDRRKDVVDPKTTAISFYCVDQNLTPILGNPKKYLELLRKYEMVIGMDASPYENMPITVQKSQIFLNLAITYYYAMNGLKIIPNVRLGDDRTFSTLEAYPKHTLIAIGTNGFMRLEENRKKFASQVRKVIDELLPIGILVYGPYYDEIFSYAKTKGIKIYKYNSFIMKENLKGGIKP